SMLNAGVPYWAAFFATLAVAFVGGLAIERVVIRPVENAPVLTIVIVCIGLLVILNSVAGWLYSYIQKPFPSPFPAKPFKIGDIFVGVTENLVGTYVRFIGTELKLTVALAMILIVLLVRPSGLFGRVAVHRV